MERGEERRGERGEEREDERERRRREKRGEREREERRERERHVHWFLSWLVLSWQHVDMCIFIRVYVFSVCYIDWRERERERERRERETCSLVSFLVGTFMAACRYVDI